MKIRKVGAVAALVLSSFAADNVAPPKSELEAMYDKAFREFDSNNFPEALKELDAIDARQPDLAESQNLRGVILMRQGIYDKAEAALHEAVRIDPKFWNARFNLAEIPFLKKDWAEARNRFQDLLTNNASELQGEATQLIQYKVLLTYLLEGKENMVDSILAKFELSPDTPAVHYANAAIALQRKNAKEAKDWMIAAEKNFSSQLNKLFAESLYEVGWLEKQAGQTRAALELTTAAERAAKSKAFARSRFEQAQQAFQQRDLIAARKFIDDADAADPNQASILNLRGEILMEQKEFDQAEAEFKKAAKADPKFREAQYNLAQVPFKTKDYAKARDRFEALFSRTPGGDKNQAAQLIKFKIYMTLLLEGKDSRAQKMMEQFQFTGDTPALYYAQAAWEFKHNNPNKATDWITSAKKIYSPALNVVFADAFYDLGWMQSPSLAASPAPAREAAVAMEGTQNESSPAIEPSPIPSTSLAKNKPTKESKIESVAAASPATTSPIAGMEATTSRKEESPTAGVRQPPAVASKESVAAGTPAKPDEVPAVPAPSLSPVVETPVEAASSPASSSAVSTAPVSPPPVSATPGVPSAPVVAASASPATVLAPARVGEGSRPTWKARFDAQTVLVGGLVLAGFGLLAWAEVRRRGIRLAVFRRASPVAGPRTDEVNLAVAAPVQKQMDVSPRITGAGPRQVSLKLKASEPSLRRAVVPVGRASRAFEPEPAIEPALPGNGELEVTAPPSDHALESVGPVIEQAPVAATPEMPEPAEWTTPAPIAVEAPTADVVEPVFAHASPIVEPEIEPVGQGQPIPQLTPVVSSEPFTPEIREPEPQAAEVGQPHQTLETLSSSLQPVSTKASISQPTTPVTMPEPSQIPTTPIVRTSASSGAPQPGAMQTTVQLTFAFEIASMQLTPAFKMGALQLRPSSKLVTMRLAPSQHPQPAMNLQVNFEIAKIQPSGGALGNVRLTPSQQQRPTFTGSPSFTVAGLQLVSDFAAAPLQLTPSQQGQASVHVTVPFQIATVEFSPSFEIASIVLNSSSKQVTVQLPGTAAPAEGAPMFEIANLQLTGSGEVGMMQLNMLGHGSRRT